MVTANTPPDAENQDPHPPSRARDMLTDHTDQYPPLEDTKAMKQARSTKKARATKLANKSSNTCVKKEVAPKFST
jgi:hypothetical protein